ncbi:hypothetical protein CSUI_004729, partial [Cystoisospora suis]
DMLRPVLSVGMKVGQLSTLNALKNSISAFVRESQRAWRERPKNAIP